jgi:phytoene dehydrogenase-like protein
VTAPDALVVGSGPNGLAAAVALARAGWRVEVREGAAEPGGGARTLPLTLPGFLHDHCSAVHPLAAASPFFRALPLAGHGLELLEPPAAVAHPFDDGTAALLLRGLGDTGATLGPDAAAWARLLGPLALRFGPLLGELLGPVLHRPRRPLLLARFGVAALAPAASLARVAFRGPRAQALFAGLAAHAVLPLERSPSAAFGLVLGAAGHAVGWPFPRGGAGRITAALASLLRAHGGELRTGAPVAALDELPPSRATLLDVGPRALAALAGDRLPAGFRGRLERFRYGPGVVKVDYALAGPVPWRARDCALAGTVHLGGTLEEIAAAEAAAWRGEPWPRPFVLVAQPSAFDPTRAPPGRHVLWAYAHVAHGLGGAGPAAAAVEAQLERFAPGFQELVLARAVRGPRDLERENPNLVGGDVGGGAVTLGQLLVRPASAVAPYATPVPGLWLCSASTPPGGGVHGMCGWNAAQAVLRRAG